MTFLNASSGKAPFLLTVLTALPIPAQLTATRRGPRDSATSSAAVTAASSVTSAAAKRYPVAKFLGDGFTVGRRKVDNDDAGTVGKKGFGRSQAEAGCSTGDDGDAVVDDHESTFRKVMCFRCVR